MKSCFILECINKTPALNNARQLLEKLCDLEINVLDLQGNPISAAENLSRFSNSQSIDEFSLSKIIKNSILVNIEQAVLDKVIESQETADLSTTADMKLVIPFIKDTSVIGFLYVRSRRPLSFTKSQTRSIQEFLKNTILEINGNDLQAFSNVVEDGQTHQKKTLNRVTNYLNQNFHLPNLNLLEVARLCNISYHHMSRLFNRELNTSFSNYLNRVRVDVASRLLKNKGLTIHEISYSCGFQDPSYFSKVFKKIKGQSPADYRINMFTPKKLKRRSSFRVPSLRV